ncbi:MAG: replicative DNA helicase [Chloroflexota bacterium]|nr:replicative DNA helicase [Chloroflexota bacterium]
MNDLEPKTVPQNIAAEEAVLGAVIIDPEGLFQILPFLRAEHFYLRKHRWIYEALVAIHERRVPLDFLTLTTELEQHEHLAGVGGGAYISQLINVVPSALNIESYAHMVEETSVRRNLLAAAGDIAKLAYEEEQSINEVVDRSEQALFAISQKRASRDLRPIQEVADSYYRWVENLYEHRGEVMGVPSGFHDLDKMLGGFQRSDLLILAARPGVGKTSLMLSLAVKAAKLGKRTAIFSLEMSAEQLVQRMVSGVSRIDAQRLRLGNLQDDDWPRFTEAVAQLSDLPIYIDDTPALNPLQLRTKCRRLHSEHGLDIVFVDYLQLMTTGHRIDNRVQEVSYLSRTLKALARELDVPVMTASQLSRAVEQRQDKHPVLSDLRASGSIEQDADVVMFIYRDEMYHPETEDQNIAELIVSKHRSGPTGTIQLYFNKRLTQFLDAAASATPAGSSGVGRGPYA